MGNNADRLDVLLLGEAARDDAAIPALTEPAGLGPHTVHQFDGDFGQIAEAVMGTLGPERRRRRLASAA
jgi:hypothetical protein